MKKKQVLAGIAIGVIWAPGINFLARPLLRPIKTRVRAKLYNIALEFIQNYDADRPND